MSKPETRTFSFEQAQMAGLFGKGVWAKYPHRMAAQRAKTYAFRDIFPDVLQGVITTEEAQEIGNQHITDYSNVIAQPVVKKVEKVVEDVVAISYTPLEDIQLELQKITDISKLGMYFKEVKPKVNVAETQKLVEMFKMRKAELSQPIETVQENV
jgi:ATP-dependent RNA circularization protein (DNA/RNA ligase family)